MSVGINFRATSGYVTDSAGETYCLAESYPTTRGGWTFGWVNAINNDGGSRDRDSAIDRRLAGQNFQWNDGTQSTFQVDLPSAGTRSVRLALGDAGFGPGYSYCQIKDGSTPLLTVTDTNGTAANVWDDATGVGRGPSSDWVTNNAASSLTFTGTTLNLVIGSPASQADLSALAHLFIGDVAASKAPPFLPGGYRPRFTSPRRRYV